MYAPIDEGLLSKVFFESSGGQSKLPLETTFSTLLTGDGITWQLVAMHLLQKYASQNGSKLMARTI